MTHHLFTQPAFTARDVAAVLGRKLGRPLAYTEGDEAVDGCVHVTPRVQIQVGADYLVVCAWVGAGTLRSWPPRRTIPRVIRDLQTALGD